MVTPSYQPIASNRVYRYFFSFILLFFFFLFFRALTGVNHVDVISLASTNRDKLDATYILFRPCYTTAANESRPGERPLSSPCCESVCRHHVDHVRGSVSQIVWQTTLTEWTCTCVHCHSFRGRPIAGRRPINRFI